MLIERGRIERAPFSQAHIEEAIPEYLRQSLLDQRGDIIRQVGTGAGKLTTKKLKGRAQQQPCRAGRIEKDHPCFGMVFVNGQRQARRDVFQQIK